MELLEREIEMLSAEGDPEARAIRAAELLHELQQAMAQAKHLRRESVQQMLAEGATFQQLADRLHLTKARVFQIANGQSGSTARYYSEGA